MSTPTELTEAIAEAAVALGRLHALLAQEPATLGMRWSERTIGHILGHEAGNVTEKYIKRNLPTMRRALEKLEAALFDEQIDDSAD